MTNKKVSTKQERSDLKKIAKIASKANKRPVKTDEEIAKEFQHLANERFKVAVKDFQERWENNNVKVGNFLTRNAELLQQDLQKFINETTKIDKINEYYRKFVYKYGLEELIEELFECIVKNISTDELNEVITLVEADVNKAIESTSAVVDGVVGFAEGSVGAVEEIYDATNAIRKNIIDYKATRAKEKIKGKSKVDQQKFLKQINDILVPLITRQAANVLRTVVETQCDDVPGEISIVTDESVGVLSKDLGEVYGIDQDSVDDYVRLLNDVSGFVTPIEICKLFKGRAEESLINSIFYFVALNYTGIHESNLYSKQRLIAFFVLVGKIVDAEEKYCKEIETNSLYSGFCFQEDSYAAKLRECLEKKESKEKIKVTFKELQKEKVRRALSVLALPTEMNNGIRSLNQSGIIDADRQIRRRALLSLAEKRKLEYDRTVNMYGDYYNVYVQRTKKVDQIIDDAFNKVANIKDEETKKQIKEYKNRLGDIGYNITEKFIMPGLFENLINIEIIEENPENPEDLSGSLSLKPYTTQEFSKRQLSSSLGSFGKIDPNYLGLAINEDKAIYNELFSHPCVDEQYISFGIDTKKAKHTFETKLNKGSVYINDIRPLIERTGSFIVYDFVNIIEGKSKYNYKEEQDFSFLGAINTNATIGELPQQIGNTNATIRALRDRYLDIVKVGYQSPFSRKIPVGIVDGVSDTGYISGLEALKLSPQIPADCVSVIRERFSLIDFPKLAVELADYPFEDKDGELDSLKKNNPTFAKVFRENYFQTLSDFKSFILDFCLKNIFFLSQFNLKYEDVSEVLADYLYEQYFHFLREDEKAIDYSLDLFGYSNLFSRAKFVEYFKGNVKEYFQNKSQIKDKLTLASIGAGLKGLEIKESRNANVKSLKNIIKDLHENHFIYLPNGEKEAYEEREKRNFNTIIEFIGYKFLPTGTYTGLKNVVNAINDLLRLSWRYYNRLIGWGTTGDTVTNEESKDINNYWKKLQSLKKKIEEIYIPAVKELAIAYGEEIYTNGRDFYEKWTGQRIPDFSSLNDKRELLRKEIKRFNDDELVKILRDSAPDHFKGYANDIDFFENKNYSGIFNVQIADDLLDFEFEVNFRETDSGPVNIVGYWDTRVELNKEQKELLSNRRELEKEVGRLNPFPYMSKNAILSGLSKRADEFASNFNYNYLYDVTNFLSHYYNNFVTSDGDKDFCFSIKELIKLEIENISLGVKDLIYDKNQIAAKNFDLEDRVVEEQFNLYFDNSSNSEENFLKNSLKDILTNKIVPHRYNNFYETGGTLDKKVEQGHVRRTVQMQLGEDGFYTTRILIDRNKVEVKVYHNAYKPQLPSRDYEKFKINEEDFVSADEILTEGPISFISEYQEIVLKGVRGDNDKKEINKFFDVDGEKLKYKKALEIVLFEEDYNNRGAKDPKIKKKFDDKVLTFEESLRKIFDGGVAGIYKEWDDDFIEGVLNRLKEAKNVANNSKKASFIRNPSKIGNVKWKVLGRPDYPFSNVYNFFRENREQRKFQIYNYQRKEADKENIKGFRKVTLTDEASGFNEFVKGKKVGYKLVKSFTIPIDNYASFQKNFEKEYGYEPGFGEYYEFCAKKEVINKLKSEMSLEDYKRKHYLKELLAMAMIQSSNLSEAIDLYRKQTAEKVSNKKILFSSKKTFSLSELGIPGLNLQQQLSFSNVANFALPILTSGLQTFMTLAEEQSRNLKFSANTARIVNNAVLGAYIKGASAIESLDRMFEFFGSDLVGGKGKGVPSPAELQEKNKALFVLFNIPTTAFSVPFWASGSIPVINIPLWISYVISEAILYTLRIVGEQEVLEQIRKLFSGDKKRVDEFVDVKNRILTECERIREEYLERNPIIKTGQTAGEKFLLPDGQEYYGNYHIHQDGTVMVGKNHETIKENIILTEIVSDKEG